jgi:hypothetical protein
MYNALRMPARTIQGKETRARQVGNVNCFSVNICANFVKQCTGRQSCMLNGKRRWRQAMPRYSGAGGRTWWRARWRAAAARPRWTATSTTSPSSGCAAASACCTYTTTTLQARNNTGACGARTSLATCARICASRSDADAVFLLLLLFCIYSLSSIKF